MGYHKYCYLTGTCLNWNVNVNKYNKCLTLCIIHFIDIINYLYKPLLNVFLPLSVFVFLFSFLSHLYSQVIP